MDTKNFKGFFTKANAFFLAIALVVVVFPYNAYAVQENRLSEQLSVVDSVLQDDKKMEELIELTKKIDECTSLQDGRYSLNCNRAVELEISNEKVTKIVKSYSEFNALIDSGAVSLDNNGKVIFNSTIINKPDDYLTFKRILSAETCSNIAFLLGVAAGIAAVASGIVALIPGIDAIAAPLLVIASGILAIGSSTFSYAASRGGCTIYVYISGRVQVI